MEPRRPVIQWRRDRELRDNARELRQLQTGAEKTLWLQLRGHKASGFHFRRQYPIDEFIVDFCCVKERLVIEVDGDCHEEPEAMAYDKWRQRRLEDLGWRLLRFRNDEVLSDPGEVRQRILSFLGKMGS